MSGPPQQAADGGRLMRSATYAAVGVAGLLATVKLVAWLMTDSVALLSSLIDSLLDAMASVVNLVAVRQALQPADADHRFGHGKAEPLAGLAQAAFVAGSAALLLIEAGSRLVDPVPVRQGAVGIGVMLFSIVATLGLVAYQKYVIRRTRSVAINADSLHYTGDVLINLSVIVSILLATLLDWTLADPLFALAIVAVLLRGAWAIAGESLDLLMDKELPDTDRQCILAIARAHPGVIDTHDLRTRSSGQQAFIQLHLELDRDQTLAQAHAIADHVETRIREAFPHAEVIIHQDPAGVRETHHPPVAYSDREAGAPEPVLPEPPAPEPPVP